MKLIELTEDRRFKDEPDPRLSGHSDTIPPIVEKYAKFYIDTEKGVFRGFLDYKISHIKGNKDILFGDNTKIVRQSSNTFNYYTLWIDNSPKWSKFPKRSESFICSNNFYIAGNYTTNLSMPYIMIPVDENTVFGVCPADDFWRGFDRHGKYMISPHDVNRGLNNLFEHFYPGENFNFNWNKFYQALVEIDQKYQADPTSEIFVKSYSIEPLFHHHKSVIKFLDNYFDPIENKFQTMTYTELLNSNYNYNEVWFANKTYLITPTYADEIVNYKNENI